MKHENKCKRKGKSVLQALEEKNLAKRMEENDKKILIRALTDRIERKSVWNFFEKVFEHVRIKCFKKLSIWFLIDRKLGSIDWKCFDWSSINRESIKTDKGWPKFLIAISIDRKIGSINRNSRKKKFGKTKQFCAKTPQSIEF